MQGYADSAKPIRLSAYQPSHLVDDVKLLIEGLGYKSCILTAHDWGGPYSVLRTFRISYWNKNIIINNNILSILSVGFVAWAFATVHPEMVDKLVVLNSPHPRAFWTFIKQSPKQFLKSWSVASAV